MLCSFPGGGAVPDNADPDSTTVCSSERLFGSCANTRASDKHDPKGCAVGVGVVDVRGVAADGCIDSDDDLEYSDDDDDDDDDDDCGMYPLPLTYPLSNASSNRSAHSARQDVPSPPKQEDDANEEVTYQRAIDYVARVRRTFENDDLTYKRFLEVLNRYTTEQKPNGAGTGVDKVLKEVTELFLDHTDLLMDFVVFLPDKLQEQATQRLTRCQRRLLEEERRFEVEEKLDVDEEEDEDEISTLSSHPLSPQITLASSNEDKNSSCEAEPVCPWIMPDASWFEEGEPLSRSWTAGRGIFPRKQSPMPALKKFDLNDDLGRISSDDGTAEPPSTSDGTLSETAGGWPYSAMFEELDDDCPHRWEASGALPRAKGFFDGALARGELQCPSGLVSAPVMLPESAKLVLLGANDPPLPRHVLRDIWELADVDNDGALCVEELALALHLCETLGRGGGKVTLPKCLPMRLLPPEYVASQLKEMRMASSDPSHWLYCSVDDKLYQNGGAIAKWVKLHGASPITGEPVTSQDLLTMKEIKLLLKPRSTEVLGALMKVNFDAPKAKHFKFNAMQCRVAGYSLEQIRSGGYSEEALGWVKTYCED